jgi:hypothetical protein
MRAQLFANSNGAVGGDVDAHTTAMEPIRNHGSNSASGFMERNNAFAGSQGAHRLVESSSKFGEVAFADTRDDFMDSGHGFGKAGTDRRRRSADFDMLDTWRTDRYERYMHTYTL